MCTFNLSGKISWPIELGSAQCFLYVAKICANRAIKPKIIKLDICYC